ncbi:MAG: hypothetical protein PVH00_11485 [Gemmatimonadota bacterium]
MTRAYSSVGRRLRWTATAFAAGVVAVLVGVAVLDSRAVVGFALFWIFLVLFYAWRTFRCPLCGAVVLFFPLGVAWRWLRTTPRLCPRCRTDYEAAAAELGRGPRRSQ